MPYLVPMAVESLSDALSQFGQAFTSAWSIIEGNWALQAIVIVPVALLVISAVMAIVRSR